MLKDMARLRPAAVAGSFYPGQRRALEAEVDELLGSATRLDRRPKALVVPHAGYVYSGPVAASAYAQLRVPLPTRVVLLGPAHVEPLRGLALPGVDAFATPLGDVPLDVAAMASLSPLPYVAVNPAAHSREHSLEVQLPFLQRLLPSFTLVPLVVGQASAAAVASVLDVLWGGAETLIVISTDLSHYLPYDIARTVDEATALAIRSCDPDIAPECACGGAGLRGLLQVAGRRNLAITQLDLRNSGDTAGDRSRVVGYGAFACYEEAGP
jgi:AmmeMemoRadiSam system protein B